MPSRIAKPKPPRASRKRRPRQHVIESISYHWLALIVSRCGHVIDIPSKDYGTDAIISTHAPGTGTTEPGAFRVQLKATDSFVIEPNNTVTFQVDTRDLRSWEEELEPRILVVFDAKLERAVWLHVQEYLRVNGIVPASLKTKTMLVKIPAQNVVDDTAVHTWRGLKIACASEIWNLLNAK